jgi:hypothetical protein
MNKPHPALVRFSSESDTVIRIETDFTDPDSCLVVFKILYNEMKRRHGAAAPGRWCRRVARLIER